MTGAARTTFGSDGYYLPRLAGGDITALPAYASLGVTGATKYTWAEPTSDARGLVKPTAFSTTARVGACDFSATSLTYDLSLTDGQPHQVALYFLEWPNQARAQTVTVKEAATGATLDTPSPKVTLLANSKSVKIRRDAPRQGCSLSNDCKRFLALDLNSPVVSKVRGNRISSV